MPIIYELYGYQISIWSNENGEPIHVHISKKKPSQNSTKLWLLSDGTFEIANNRSKVPETLLMQIIRILNKNAEDVRNFWIAYHGYEKYIR